MWLFSAHLASIILNTINLQTILYNRECAAETVEMGDRNANTRRKVVGWIWLRAEEFLWGLAPLAIVCLILALCARGVLYLLFAFGIKTAPETNNAEDAVFLLAMIVVPLLLRIARVLEEIVRRLE